MATKSFTVSIGADTSKFIKDIKKAQREVDQTGKQIKELEKALAIKWDNTKFVRAQKLAQEALAKTEASAERVRQKLNQFKTAGHTDTAEYQKLETELLKLENKAEKARDTLASINKLKFTTISNKISAVGAKITNLGNSLRGISTTALAGIAGLTKLGTNAVAVADDLATLATNTGISIMELQKLQYIAIQSDVPLEKLSKAVLKTNTAFSDIARGEISTATRALEELGLASQHFETPEQKLMAVVEALQNLTDEEQQASIMADIFGERIALDLMSLLAQGKGAIQEYLEEFTQIGAMSEETVLELAEFDNVMNKMKASVANAGAKLGASLLPVMDRVTQFITDKVVPSIEKLTGWFESLGEKGQNTVLRFLLVFVTLSPLVGLFGKLTSGIGDMTKMLTALNIPASQSAVVFGALGASLFEIGAIIANWADMNSWQKVISILGTLTTVALGAAIAMGAFHSAWSMGLASAGIVAGITAVIASVESAKKSANANMPSFDYNSIQADVDKAMKSNLEDYKQFAGEIIQDNRIDNSKTEIKITNEAGDTAEDLVRKINQALKMQASARS